MEHAASSHTYAGRPPHTILPSPQPGSSSAPSPPPSSSPPLPSHCSWHGVQCSSSSSPPGSVVSVSLPSNGLRGELPPSFWTISTLESVDFGAGEDRKKAEKHPNRLEGVLPETIGALKALRHLDLGGNLFSGAVPESFGDLSSLEFANLGNNRLTSIPSSIGNLSSDKLTSLFFPFNYLEGHVPPSLGNLKSLTDLSLGFNRLSGPLPSSLGSLKSLSFVTLAYNDLEGEIPLPLQNLCQSPSTLCEFTGNNRLCPDGQRVISESCEAFPSCAPLGECHGNRDSKSYLCARCIPGFYEDGGSCKDCRSSSSPSSVVFASSLVAALFVACLAAVALVRRGYVKPGKVKLGLRNQVRAKQIGSVLQMVPLLTTLASYPEWFASVSAAFGRVSLPVVVSPPCFEDVGKLDRWLEAALAFAALYAVVGALVGVRHLFVAVGAKVEPKIFFNLQIVAGFLVTQSPLVLLRMSFSAQEIVSDVIDTIYTFSRDRDVAFNVPLSAFIPEALSFFVALFIMVFTYSVIQSGSFYLQKERRAFQALALANEDPEKKASASVSGEGEQPPSSANSDSIEYQLSTNLPFWSFFGGLSYTPSCADFESRVFLRKCLSFILPHLVFFSTFFVLAFDSLENNRHSSVYHVSPFPRFDATNLPLTASSINAVLFVLVQCHYLKSTLRRPYISNRRSAHYGDALNDAEVLASRALSWTATMFVIREGLFSTEWGRSNFYWAGSLICAVLLVVLVAVQWTLFSDAIRDFRKFILTTSLARWCALRMGLPLTREVRANSAYSEGASASKIEAMLRCDNPLEMFRLQAELDVAVLEGIERPRWQSPPTPSRPSFLARWWQRFVTALLLAAAASLLVVTLLFVLYASCTAPAVRWVWLSVAVVITIGMEVMIYASGVRAKMGGNSSTRGVKEAIESGVSVNPVLRRQDPSPARTRSNDDNQL